MKRLNLCLLSIMTIIFMIPSKVEAFHGPASYDINKVTVSGSNLVIEGWAAIKDNRGNEMDNINPTYTFQLVGKDKNGVEKVRSISYVNKNERSRTGYSSGSDSPRDYTKAYFTKVDQHYPTAKTSLRGKLVKDTYNVYPYNHFYINIDFKFEIPIVDFQNLLKLSERIYFDLKVVTKGASNITIFGYSGFRTVAASQVIHLGVQDDRVTDITKEQFGGLTFNNSINQLSVLVSNGFVQGSETGFLTNNYRLVWRNSAIVPKPSSGSFTSLYYFEYYTYGSKANYTVLDREFKHDLSTSNQYGYYYYTIRVKNGGSCYSGLCVKDAPTNGTIAYVPAFWAIPVPGHFIYVTGGCKNNSSCNPLTDSCPTSCCADMCTIEGNKTTNFCTKICETTPPPSYTTPCSTNPDPQVQYCCYHPDDKEVCDKSTPGGSEDDPSYPDQDSPINRNAICKDSGVTNVNFKYPTQGWGKTLLTNNACSISCQETLHAQFQPSQSVRAGMGFEYPVKINSSRYCTADYDNVGWKKKVDDAATIANDSYTKMVVAINAADTLDAACGTKVTLTASVPSCPSPYNDGRSGLRCSCNGCETCWHTCSKDIYIPSYSCGTVFYPRTCGGYSYTSFYSCDPYACDGSTYVSCPSREGHSLSYNSSTDDCRKDICSISRQTWSTAQSAISSKLAEASKYRNQYNLAYSTINTLVRERNTCDNYVADNKYTGASNTKIGVNVPKQSSYTITSSSYTEDTTFESGRKIVWTTYPIYQCNTHPYDSQYLVGDHNSTARSFAGTYCDYRTANKTYSDFWNKKSDAKLNFQFSTYYYVQRYTGELSSATRKPSGYEDGGRYSYTDFYAPSGTNNFNLTIKTMGPNIPGISNNLWSINPFTCKYIVNNLIFPPAGDPNNDKYGNTGFMYRQVSLTNPFPNRNPGENWQSQKNLIISQGYKVYSNTPIYEINLSPVSLQNIRRSGTNYASFYTNDPYRSMMVESYIRSGVIIKEK